MTTDLLTIAKGIADRAEAESAKENVPVPVTVIPTASWPVVRPVTVVPFMVAAVWSMVTTVCPLEVDSVGMPAPVHVMLLGTRPPGLNVPFKTAIEAKIGLTVTSGGSGAAARAGAATPSAIADMQAKGSSNFGAAGHLVIGIQAALSHRDAMMHV